MKRVFDFSMALVMLFFLAPFLTVLAVIIRIKLGSPILFKQKRPGLYAKPFLLYKFRTMTNECDEQGHLLADEARLTPFGSFLRKYSLDEWPQLINVLKGELSFVGPRPLLMEYLPYYSEEEFKRHLVVPGITGWAQINGRNDISWEEKFAYDLWYISHHSFWLDLKIIFLTFNKVIHSEGITKQGMATVEYFERPLKERLK